MSAFYTSCPAVLLWFAVTLMFAGGDAAAQCSRGGQGVGTGGPVGVGTGGPVGVGTGGSFANSGSMFSLGGTVMLPDASSFARSLAIQQLAIQQQANRQLQRLIASRRQASQRRSEALYATRMANAQKTRQARAERIAALRAKYGGSGSSEVSPPMYASASPATTLVSANSNEPLD